MYIWGRGIDTVDILYIWMGEGARYTVLYIWGRGLYRYISGVGD